MRFFDFGQEATGVIAIGQIATGVVAIGQFATGVIAVGQISRGVIAVGQMSLGVVAAGQLAVGIAYGTGMLGLGAFAGGLIPISLFGRLSLPDLARFRFHLDRSRPTSWKWLLMTAAIAVIAVFALIPLWEALFAANGVFHPPPTRR